MTNPIPQCNLFATPDSLNELLDWCLAHNGAEKIIALTAANMALNIAHKLVNEQLEETSV